MLGKQLVSATQGLQPKLVSSRDALLQPVVIRASALLLLFHLQELLSSLWIPVRPVRVAVPTPRTHHCLTPLLSRPGRQLSLGKAWPAQDGAEDHSSTLPSTSPCLDPSCSYSSVTLLLLLPKSPCRGFLATHWSKLLAAR